MGCSHSAEGLFKCDCVQRPVQFGQYPDPGHVVAHLSDPHLLAGNVAQYGVVDTEANLRLALERLERLDPAPQVVWLMGNRRAGALLDGVEPTRAASGST